MSAIWPLSGEKRRFSKPDGGLVQKPVFDVPENPALQKEFLRGRIWRSFFGFLIVQLFWS
jgi:hypothetical protein